MRRQRKLEEVGTEPALLHCFVVIMSCTLLLRLTAVIYSSEYSKSESCSKEVTLVCSELKLGVGPYVEEISREY